MTLDVVSGKVESQVSNTPAKEVQAFLEASYLRRIQPVRDTIDSARLVRHYKDLPAENSAFSTYSDFCKSIPITTSQDLFPTTDFYWGDPDKLILHASGGSTGKRVKEIAISPDAVIMKFSDKVIDILKKAKNPVLLHKDLHILSYLITEDSVAYQAPNVKVEKYKLLSQATEKIKGHDVVLITEQTSKFRELMHYFEKMAKQSETKLKETLKDKKFLIELGSEPIDINEVKEWYNFLYQYSGVVPEIWGLYGTTETLLIGLGIYHPGDERINYEVKDDMLVEVLNEKGELVSPGEEGRVVVTPLRPHYMGTNLLRYETGDFAKVSISSENKMMLYDVHRNAEDGMLSLWGYKIYIPQVHAILENVLGYPVNLEMCATTKESPAKTGELIELKMNLFSEEFIGEEEITGAKDKLLEALGKAIPDLQTFLDDHKLEIEANFGNRAPPNFIKAWRFLRSTGEQQYINKSFKIGYKGDSNKEKSNASYEDMGVEFDELFEDVDTLTKLEAKSIDGILRHHGVKTVLDCACGTGIQALGLSELGYNVSASDISPTMVSEIKRKAESQGLNIETKQADFTELAPWQGRVFDAVINCGHSILYFDSLDKVTQALTAMQRVVKKDGLIVISVHNYLKLKREGRDFEFRRRRINNGVPEWIYDIRVFDDKKVTASHVFTRMVNRRFYTRAYPKTSLLVTPTELRDCMQKSGLNSVELFDLVTLQPFKDEDWILAVGQKA